MTRTTTLCALGLLASASFGQNVCAVITPNPLIVGQSSTTLNVLVRDVTGIGVDLQANCAGYTIRAGVPGGSFTCNFLNLCGPYAATGPYGTASSNFTVGCLQPGLYYVEVRYRITGSTSMLTEWFPFAVVNPSDPTLTPSTTTPQIGQTLILNLAAPSDPLQPYYTGASLTTNTGFSAVGLFVSLDLDALFNLTIPVPLAGVFMNFQGVTDQSGNATLGVIIPNDQSLSHLPLHVQTLVAPLGGSPKLTNPLNICIL